MLFKDFGERTNRNTGKGLNPYSNGICSLSRQAGDTIEWVDES